MTPDDHTTAIHALQNDVSEIKAILNRPEGTPQASTASVRWSMTRRAS